MTRSTFVASAGAALILAVAMLAPALAQTSAPQTPPQPFAPSWAMLAGWDVFAAKGCGKCHAVRGAGGMEGPDLARIAAGKSFFELGADMWNHLPRMGARMRELGIERPQLTPTETANLIAFLFTAKYHDELGDSNAGEKVWAAKSCAQCHALGGSGGRVGPALDSLKRTNSPVLVAAAMWNHGPRMADEMRARGITRPTFQGKELVDLVAYVTAAASDPGGDTGQVIPGTPDRGRQLFTEKKCVTCHAVGGKGGRVGPDLGRPGHQPALTEFAGQMWNHAPAMVAKMKERRIDYPQLTGQQMADILAYLYVSRYFEPVADAARGAQAVQTKNCVSCHSVRGKGGKVAADFAKSTVVATPAALIAAMWNHSRLMEAKAEQREVQWPTLTGQDLDDISAYLAGLRSRTAPKAPTR
jgi:mono/diheme cytochrome c family protein